MKADEIEAILGYLEFHLIKFVEEMERHITDPDIIGGMYDKAHNILKDFEETLDQQHLIDRTQIH